MEGSCRAQPPAGIALTPTAVFLLDHLHHPHPSIHNPSIMSDRLDSASAEAAAAADKEKAKRGYRAWCVRLNEPRMRGLFCSCPPAVYSLHCRSRKAKCDLVRTYQCPTRRQHCASQRASTTLFVSSASRTQRALSASHCHRLRATEAHSPLRSIGAGDSPPLPTT